MSEQARARSSHRLRSYAAGLVWALALATPAAVMSSSVAQVPVPPLPPGTPVPPGAPPTPDDPPAGEDPPAPPPEAAPSKLSPFPVVVVAGRQGERSTKVSELSVRGPRKARVVVRCLGKRCPLRRTDATIPRSKRLRVRKAQRVYRAGLVLEIRVTGADRVGKYTRVRFRGGRTPARTDACLQPGASKPSACQ